MLGPFVPKDFLVAPHLFGNPLASWRPWDPEDDTRVARAWLQHCFVGRISVAIEEETSGIADFALQVGDAERTVKSKLAGRLPIGLDDVVGWSFLLGVDKYPQINQRRDLLPPDGLVRSDFTADVVPMPRRQKGS
jgi:hypothetical protein